MRNRDPQDPNLYCVPVTHQFVHYAELARFLSVVTGRPTSCEDVLVLGGWQVDQTHEVNIMPDRVWHPQEVDGFLAGKPVHELGGSLSSILNKLGEQEKLPQGKYLVDTTWTK